MRIWGDFTKEEEYGHALHCSATDFGPLQGNGAEDGGVVCENLVGARTMAEAS